MFDFDVERDFRRPLTSHLVRTVRFTEYAIENSVENSYTPSMRPHPSQPEDNERGVAKCLAPMLRDRENWTETGTSQQLKYCRATVQVQGLKLPYTPWFVTCYRLLEGYEGPGRTKISSS